jgi:hypothetical protein
MDVPITLAFIDFEERDDEKFINISYKNIVNKT